MPIRREYDTILQCSRVRVSAKKRQKKACPARVAEAGQENIETVHEPKPIQAAGHPLYEDKVAVLWRISTAHKPRY
jgi:hypothetical protein